MQIDAMLNFASWLTARGISRVQWVTYPVYINNGWFNWFWSGAKYWRLQNVCGIVFLGNCWHEAPPCIETSNKSCKNDMNNEHIVVVAFLVHGITFSISERRVRACRLFAALDRKNRKVDWEQEEKHAAQGGRRLPPWAIVGLYLIYFKAHCNQISAEVLFSYSSSIFSQG
jgi:hypothetical protein